MKYSEFLRAIEVPLVTLFTSWQRFCKLGRVSNSRVSLPWATAVHLHLLWECRLAAGACMAVALSSRWLTQLNTITSADLIFFFSHSSPGFPAARHSHIQQSLFSSPIRQRSSSTIDHVLTCAHSLSHNTPKTTKREFFDGFRMWTSC